MSGNDQAEPAGATVPSGRFAVGDRVRVLEGVAGGNPRTPGYLRGRTGTVVKLHGVVVNPLDHHEAYPALYSISFRLESSSDEIIADIHDEWLEPHRDDS